MTENGIENGTENGIENFAEQEEKILTLIKKNKNISKKNVAQILKIGTTTVSRYIESLKVKGVIERIGSDKGGYWKIKRNDKEN